MFVIFCNWATCHKGCQGSSSLQAYLQPEVEGSNHFHIPAAVLVRKKPIDGCWFGPVPLWIYGEGDLCSCHY